MQASQFPASIVLLATVGLACSSNANRSTEDPCAVWMDTSLGPDARAQALVSAMTLEQKIDQTHGHAPPEDFRVVRGIEELCIPDLTVTNGPAGVGPGPEILNNVPATALPSPLLLASTWDPIMAEKYGNVQGAEMVAIGRNLLEAPDVDLARVPINGRTFEAYGEDPWLVSRIGVANIQAIQSYDIIAMVKHYTVNNQEADRNFIDVQVSDRALRELYLPPFEAAVREAEVASVMCSYNSVNGAFSCENEEILTNILKGDWGFQGFVQSDFFAMRSTVKSANAGMDLEMPAANFYGEALLAAVTDGAVPESRVDDMLLRRFREMFRFGLFDREPMTSPIPVDEHAEIAREIGAAGSVLLRNEVGLLPLDATQPMSIALLGPWATQAATGGGGSSRVNPIRAITPAEAITNRLDGTDVQLTIDADAGPAEAAQLASEADIAVVVVGNFETEAADRKDMSLPDEQDALIAAIAAANPQTIVFIHAGSPILMPWVADVAAIVEGWYPGGEDGETTVALLFGDIYPSGKLPITFPVQESDGLANTPERYPGVDGKVYYDEELQVGYRWFQSQDITPLFPFGFGLSYTTFMLGDLSVATPTIQAGDPVTLQVPVTNIGNREGAEVVQA
ncbi:MAG: glycoside hydrolase family 3 C-terminal domain-containing protein, partial [Deltaproteobacteria bacterium]|nr:glycoside hydrolase family 3 C-terminal domain-containing protein [Deltaproteobacteria bacterium]